MGLPCGTGPPLEIDGHPYPTSATTTIGDLTGFQPATVRRATYSAQPFTYATAGVAPGPTASAEAPRLEETSSARAVSGNISAEAAISPIQLNLT